MGGERRRRAPTVLHFEPVRPPEARTAGAAPHCLPGYPAILSLAWRPLASQLSITFQTLRAGFAGWRGGTCPSSGRRTGSASPPTTSAGGPPSPRLFGPFFGRTNAHHLCPIGKAPPNFSPRWACISLDSRRPAARAVSASPIFRPPQPQPLLSFFDPLPPNSAPSRPRRGGWPRRRQWRRRRGRRGGAGVVDDAEAARRRRPRGGGVGGSECQSSAASARRARLDWSASNGRPK